MLPFDPKKPLYSFVMRAPHAKRRIHLFTDNRFIYFRPKNAPPDWWGVILGEAVFFKVALGRRDGKFYRFAKSVRAYIEQGNFLRVLHVDAPKGEAPRHWRILWRPEIGFVIPSNHPEGLDGAFFSPQATRHTISLWKTPTQILQHNFESEWQNPNSDVRAALLWCDLVAQEREWRAIKWEKGNRNDLEDVVKAMLMCAPIREEQKRISVAYSWPTSGADESPIRIYLFKGSNNPHNERCNILTPRIERIYRSHYDLPRGRRDDWPLPWPRHSGENYRSGRVWYPIEPPTQHESMEASLLLRDWLRENAPDLMADWFPDAV